MRGLGRLRQLKLLLGKRLLSGSCVIILYHRITSLESDPQMLAVSPENFAQHLEVIQNYGTVIPLMELTGRIKANNLPKRTVIITFDDGYADNLLVAKPILQRHEMPATVFVASDGAEQKEEFYWDELDRILLWPGELPRELCVNIDGQNVIYDLGDSAHYDASDFQLNHQWNVSMDYVPTPRHYAYRDLCAKITHLTPYSRCEIMASLREQMGSAQVIRDTHRTMTALELRELVNDGLIDIGAHTMGHSYIAALDEKEQYAEMEKSKLHLEQILGREVPTFSYPYGTKSSYSQIAVQFARKIGFQMACSNFAEPITLWTDNFQLPRHIARDWDGDEFSRFLERCFK